MSNYDPSEWCSCGEHFEPDEKYCSNCGKERLSNSVKTDKNKTIIKADAHLCPSCGKEMHLGYIYSAKRMTWKEPETKWFFSGEKLNSDASGIHLFTGNQLESFRCKNCRIININY